MVMTSTGVRSCWHQHAGRDDGANPVEHLLQALAIEALVSALMGDISLRGFHGLAADVPKGYTEIRARFRVKAMTEDLPQIRDLAAFSPVFNTLTGGARVVNELQGA